MKRKLLLASAALATIFGFSATANAQDKVVYIPVDIITCKFNEGRGPADLDAVVEKWNKYMDDNKRDKYAAWTLTKHYASADQDFDFIWLGAHRNATSMGEGADMWESTGGAVRAEFAKVASCDMTGNYASRMFKAPPKGNVPEGGVLAFANCSLRDGASYDDVITATNTWAKALGEAGSQSAMYHWYPIYGTNENDIDWKAITAYPNHAEMGKDYDRMGNGGMHMQSRELLGAMVDCDVPRMYDVTVRRTAKIRD